MDGTVCWQQMYVFWLDAWRYLLWSNPEQPLVCIHNLIQKVPLFSHSGISPRLLYVLSLSGTFHSCWGEDRPISRILAVYQTYMFTVHVQYLLSVSPCFLTAHNEAASYFTVRWHILVYRFPECICPAWTSENIMAGMEPTWQELLPNTRIIHYCKGEIKWVLSIK